MRCITAEGPEYLRLASTLLQRMRLASPEGGIWEAADIQWWWRREQRAGQTFWLDEGGAPMAAFLSTDFGHSVQCDVLVMPGEEGLASNVWLAAIDLVDEGEFTVRLDDRPGIAALGAVGYTLADPAGVVTCWQDAAGRQDVTGREDGAGREAGGGLARGYRLLSRAEEPDRPHPLITRNGPDVERRLRECSLYRAELDLVVVAPDGQSAGYGLFWADPVTGVGLVEPIRIEEGHQGRGLASHLVGTGLDLLTGHGCRRLKVGNDRGLYRRAGFRRLDSATAAIYTRSGTTGHGNA
jgi:GNAT superfamily N-acetyltransferase